MNFPFAKKKWQKRQAIGQPIICGNRYLVTNRSIDAEPVNSARGRIQPGEGLKKRNVCADPEPEEEGII
jgi:hypothetical protein